MKANIKQDPVMRKLVKGHVMRNAKGTARRTFFGEVGSGMLIAAVGPQLALDMSLAKEGGEKGVERLHFGSREKLVDWVRKTPADKLIPSALTQLRQGTTVKELVAAAALANAEAFGGEDYIGFHTFMALGPSLVMADRLAGATAALPVLKVLHRNASRLYETGGCDHATMTTVAANTTQATAESLRQAVRQRKRGDAEATLAGIAERSREEALKATLEAVHEGAEVHRIVLASRCWDMLNVVGADQALTMLRQSIRYCIKTEEFSSSHFSELRTQFPRWMDQFKLSGKALGTRTMDDAWLESTCRQIYQSKPTQAAEAVAGMLAEGISPDSIGQALAMVANQLVLRDPGRRGNQIQPNKPAGSVHGDSIGVHASDSMHAWLNLATLADSRNTMASLVLAAYQVARDRGHGSSLQDDPLPFVEPARKLAGKTGAELLRDLDAAIRTNNQVAACSATLAYGESGQSEKPVFDLLLRYAISEDGALHAEKYYMTVVQEFARARPVFRWRQLIALARVTASEFGKPAPGVEEATRLLGASLTAKT